MLRMLAALAMVTAAAGARRNPWKSGAAPPPVKSFNPLRYVGRWYQMYDDLTAVYESRYCVTADYGLFANWTVSVRNRERQKSVTGAETDILGYAIANRTGLDEVSGGLAVILTGVPVPAPYDVILLGDATFGDYGTYQWAVVSDPFELSLFVLARDVNEFNAKYNQTVFDELEKLGFDTLLNKPIPTLQQGCPEYSETDLSYCNGEFGA